MNIQGKVCVVTGGASGIGEAVSRAFVAAGARGVAIADLNAERLRTVANEIGALAVPTDVSREADIKALIAATEEKFGPIDIFYSNAGISRAGQ
jgi:NAD(P)-dependent dehydrogenase (short-subunit alcohol dehydrogenase family)